MVTRGDMRHELEPQQVPDEERKPTSPEQEPGRQAIASAVGNRAFARAVAARAVRPATLARDLEVPPAPVTLNAPAEREQDAPFPEEDKQRARLTLIAPLRAAGAQLSAGPKANIPSVLRHLRTIRAAAAGVKWPQARRDEAFAAFDAEDFDAVRTMLDSLKLGDRQAVTQTRKRWASAAGELKQAVAAIHKAEPDQTKHPDEQPRAGASQDVNAIAALRGQVEATSKDLAEAPRTQEGFAQIEDTAVGVLAMFDTITPPDDQGFVSQAKDTFKDGIATLAPLALGKEEAIKAAQEKLVALANRFAGIVGDEAPAPDQPDDEPDPSAQHQNLEPAPSPHPLPPPPPPPVPGTDKTPAGAGAH
jgi:hypothetical protein